MSDHEHADRPTHHPKNPKKRKFRAIRPVPSPPPPPEEDLAPSSSDPSSEPEPVRVSSGDRSTKQFSFRLPKFWYNWMKDYADSNGISHKEAWIRAAQHFRNSLEIDDSWEVLEDDDEDATYSVRKFYTRSSDKEGSITVRAAIPKTLYGRMQRIVQSGDVYDYGTYQDMIRDALRHRLKQVAEWIDDMDLDRIVLREMNIANTMRIQEEENQADELERIVIGRCEQLIGQQRWEDLRQYLNETVGDAVLNLPEPWAGRMRDKIRKVRAELRRATKD